MLQENDTYPKLQRPNELQNIEKKWVIEIYYGIYAIYYRILPIRSGTISYNQIC